MWIYIFELILVSEQLLWPLKCNFAVQCVRVCRLKRVKLAPAVENKSDPSVALSDWRSRQKRGQMLCQALLQFFPEKEKKQKNA